ncbi:MAG: hypothetical protein AABP62_26895 [Planctomycetota bacterium]
MGRQKNNRLRVEYVRDLRKAVKPVADGSKRLVSIPSKYQDAWAEIERVCRKRFGSSITLAAINKLTSEVAERFDIRILFVDAMDLNSFWAKLKECEATDVHEAETRGGAADDDNVATRASSGFVESQPAGQTKVQPVDDATAGTPLLPSSVEFQRFREFAHGLSGDEAKVFELLLARLDNAAKSNGLPLKASEADVTPLIHLQGEWKFSTFNQWKGLQTRLTNKLKSVSIKWRVSARGGAHLCRTTTSPKREPSSQRKARAKPARTPR